MVKPVNCKQETEWNSGKKIRNAKKKKKRKKKNDEINMAILKRKES